MTLWVRVDADVGDNPKVGRFAAALGIEIETAIGHLVRVWGKMAGQNSDGKLTRVRGVTIESWANWRGKKGRFAEVFRRHFVVKGGIVHGWGERQGKLILRQIARGAYMKQYHEAHPRNSSRAVREQLPNSSVGAPEQFGNGLSTALTLTKEIHKRSRTRRPAKATAGEPAQVADIMQRWEQKATPR